MPNAYQVISSYDADKGITVSINKAVLQLSVADICYLLLKVDGQATLSSYAPPDHIPFVLKGKAYAFSNEEWMDFQDQLSSVAGAGGWNHTLCNNSL